MSIRCVKCSVRLSSRIKRHRLSDETEQTLESARKWLHPQVLAGEEYLCHACYCHMWERINQDSAQPLSATMGLNVCVICSKSILGIRSRKLLGTEKSKRGRIVAYTIAEWIHPRELQPSDGVCIPCWLRAKRATNKSQQNNRAEVVQERSSNTATANQCLVSTFFVYSFFHLFFSVALIVWEALSAGWIQLGLIALFDFLLIVCLFSVKYLMEAIRTGHIYSRPGEVLYKY
ncbi:uncharacterized protein LOC114351466 isoform X2 [Ostrinia furnacalis]|uniref:uncharacterized protein LOC114351466 isoform X2 n=1 Tax=Ostrinia furnacalis TaxID=93504 RepID=UPI00103A77A4|nr:uncharacterized protein LOC114351466 isoform X2 [Ostrinia furnacalis]